MVIEHCSAETANKNLRWKWAWSRQVACTVFSGISQDYTNEPYSFEGTNGGRNLRLALKWTTEQDMAWAGFPSAEFSFD